MDGVLKYKTLFREWDDPVRHFLLRLPRQPRAVNHL